MGKAWENHGNGDLYGTSPFLIEKSTTHGHFQ
jgi:hypothetical protein